MRILLLIPEIMETGGFVTYTRHLYKSLKMRDDCEVMVSYLTNTPKYKKALVNHTEMKPIPFPKKSPKQLAEQLTKMFDVIHVPYIYLTADSKRDLKEKSTCYELEVLRHIPQEKLFLSMHDTVEIKNIKSLRIPGVKPNYIFIRQRQLDYFKEILHEDEPATWIMHPYVRECVDDSELHDNKENLVISTARVDWDKHYEIIVEAAEKLKNVEYRIHTSHINRIYYYQKLKDTKIDEYLKGGFSYFDIGKVYKPAKIMWDMTAIHMDGGGSQYTFLEAFDFGVVPILNSKWDIPGNKLKENVNCLYASNAEELAQKTLTLLNDAKQRNSMVEFNKTELKLHDPIKTTDEYIKFYKGG